VQICERKDIPYISLTFVSDWRRRRRRRRSQGQAPNQLCLQQQQSNLNIITQSQDEGGGEVVSMMDDGLVSNFTMQQHLWKKLHWGKLMFST
jgi:hypothetical protein